MLTYADDLPLEWLMHVARGTGRHELLPPYCCFLHTAVYLAAYMYICYYYICVVLLYYTILCYTMLYYTLVYYTILYY